MDVDAAQHWEAVYLDRGPDNVSWYQREPAISLRLLALAGARPGSSVVDIGGGASVLVDRLLDEGIEDACVLDISGAALDVSRRRLGSRAATVTWLARDLLTWQPERRFDIWHDRAVFHFLTDPADRTRYARVLEAALADGGRAVFGTFAGNGPEFCSGLPVERYGPEALAAEFPRLRLVHAENEQHHTPSGAVQEFTWVVLARP